MRKILGIFRESQDQKTAIPEQNEAETETSKISESKKEKDYISDNDLLSNPFFTTLTPLN